MKRPRKLDLTELRVESFDTTPDGAAARGTVHAHDTGATCGGICTDPDCNSGEWDCDSLGCGSGEPDTCYAGCENTCRDTYTSQWGWVSCNHSQCYDYTCDPNGSCDLMSGEFAC